jgi:8-oxo-dGTP pyrophosphatase MutT (NUDIX family)
VTAAFEAPNLVRRTAVRLVVLDPAELVLLLHYITPDTHEDFWCTPGGALAAGETFLDAAQRELREEIGVDWRGASLGPRLWRREHRFRVGDGSLYVQDEHYFVLHLPHCDPVFGEMSDFERRAIVGYHWWRRGEMRASAATFQPECITALLDALAHRPDVVLEGERC